MILAVMTLASSMQVVAADGINGSRTVNAINAYRAANSLDQNGLIDDEMLNSLGI